MMIAGGIIGGAKTEVAYIATGVNTSSPSNSYSFDGRSFGAEHPSRQIIVLVRGNNANLVSDQNYTTAVNIGGVAATRKVQPTENTISHMTAWITPRMDNGGPTGTSGTIQLVRSVGNGFTSGVAFVAFAAYGLRDGGEPFGSIRQVASGSLAVPGGGILTAMGMTGGTGAVFNWTGAEEAATADGGIGTGNTWSAALLNKTSADDDHFVSAGAGVVIAVSWR